MAEASRTRAADPPAASVKHSRLLGDFMRDVVAGHVRRFEESLVPSDWDAFLADCIQRDPAVAGWSDTTKAKLLQVVLRIPGRGPLPRIDPQPAPHAAAAASRGAALPQVPLRAAVLAAMELTN